MPTTYTTTEPSVAGTAETTTEPAVIGTAITGTEPSVTGTVSTSTEPALASTPVIQIEPIGFGLAPWGEETANKLEKMYGRGFGDPITQYTNDNSK